MAEKSSRIKIIIEGVTTKFKTAIAEVRSTLTRIYDQSIKINQSIELFKTTIGAVVNTVQRLWQAFRAGAEIAAVAEGFERLSKAAGNVSSVLLRDLRAAVRGTMSDMKLMQVANQAMIAGMNPQMMITALSYLRAYAVNTGKSFEQLVSTIFTGLTRGSVLMLDDAGIIISQTALYEQKARELGRTLTDTEKRQAILNETMRQMTEKLPDLAGAMDSELDKADQIAVRFENIINRITTKWKSFVVLISDEVSKENLLTSDELSQKQRDLLEAEYRIYKYKNDPVYKFTSSLFYSSKKQQEDIDLLNISLNEFHQIKEKIKKTEKDIAEIRDPHSEEILVLKEQLQLYKQELAILAQSKATWTKVSAGYDETELKLLREKLDVAARQTISAPALSISDPETLTKLEKMLDAAMFEASIIGLSEYQKGLARINKEYDELIKSYEAAGTWTPEIERQAKAVRDVKAAAALDAELKRVQGVNKSAAFDLSTVGMDQYEKRLAEVRQRYGEMEKGTNELKAAADEYLKTQTAIIEAEKKLAAEKERTKEIDKLDTLIADAAFEKTLIGLNEYERALAEIDRQYEKLKQTDPEKALMLKDLRTGIVTGQREQDFDTQLESATKQIWAGTDIGSISTFYNEITAINDEYDRFYELAGGDKNKEAAADIWKTQAMEAMKARQQVELFKGAFDAAKSGLASGLEELMKTGKLNVGAIVTDLAQSLRAYAAQKTAHLAMEAAFNSIMAIVYATSNPALAAGYTQAASVASGGLPVMASIVAGFTAASAIGNQFHSGIDYVPKDMQASLIEGEAVLPKRLNVDLREFLADWKENGGGRPSVRFEANFYNSDEKSVRNTLPDMKQLVIDTVVGDYRANGITRKVLGGKG